MEKTGRLGKENEERLMVTQEQSLKISEKYK